ncbi:hypothetical protein JG688_00013261 [Phytophthora aleatoria]|uniref:Ubiquitin-like protease family profile domain-containing protein n=1 Tax=Phytophthora aleatoria TaxID=2496075 RepID=A0A8J5IXL1_9STRA|nr:hypothetical protein JG688_00013261 [Phytophthora aleatoria]
MKGYVFLPVKFDTHHWACLVINKIEKQLQVYDTMNKRKTAKVLKWMMAREIDEGVLQSKFKQLTIKKPRQKDGDSCGIFVCLQFWTQVSSNNPQDVAPVGLVRLRWKMLQALLDMKA